MPFTGRALFDSGAITGVAEDVSDIITMISPRETPLLDALSPPPRAATNVIHEWLEDQLGPDTVQGADTVNDSVTTWGLSPSDANFLTTGTVLRTPRDEYVQITAINGNTLTITRGFGSSTADTITLATNVNVISDASIEGEDATRDISRNRTRTFNPMQIFKKDVIVSGSMEAVSQLGDIDDEFAYQQVNRMKELVRDLEKAVILGISAGSTLGTASTYRTMGGLINRITTNVTSYGTLSNTAIDIACQAAWDAGARDLNLLLVGSAGKRSIDYLNNTQTQVEQVDDSFQRVITLYENSFGVFRVIMSPWMIAGNALVLASERLKVVPLQGRSFQFNEVARTGDSRKGFIVGEYTLETKNENGMSLINQFT